MDHTAQPSTPPLPDLSALAPPRSPASLAAVRHWWVNHKQTFRHEFDGHYIWAPKQKRNGQANRYYDFLRAVCPGDLVFSYAAGLRGAGTAVSYAYNCPKPGEFGKLGSNWDDRGWRVDVRFVPFPVPLHPRDHWTTLAPLFAAEEHPPLRPDGKGLQHIYLTSISEALAFTLLDLAGRPRVPHVADAPESPGIEERLAGQDEWDRLLLERLEQDASLDRTSRTELIEARVGQGIFKRRVHRLEHACRLTFVDDPAHLVASHIKPWRMSDNSERLHQANGLLLTPTADHLFDRGFITFADEGDVILSPVLDRTSALRMGLDADRPPAPVPFHGDQRHFLDFHRREIFLAAPR